MLNKISLAKTLICAFLSLITVTNTWVFCQPLPLLPTLQRWPVVANGQRLNPGELINSPQTFFPTSAFPNVDFPIVNAPAAQVANSPTNPPLANLPHQTDPRAAWRPAALQLAARFTTLLQKSPDFAPIVTELFAPDYLDCQKQLLIDRSSLFFRDLNLKLEFTQAPDTEVARYQLLLLRFFHLQLLIDDQGQQQTGNTVNILEHLPAFAALLQRESLLRTIFMLEKGPPLKVRTPDEWRKLNDQLDKVVTIFADYLTAHPLTGPLGVAAPEFFPQLIDLPCQLSNSAIVFVQVPIDNFLPLPQKPVTGPENDQIRQLYNYLLVFDTPTAKAIGFFRSLQT